MAWNEKFVFGPIGELDKAELTVELYDWDEKGADDEMGRVVVDLSQAIQAVGRPKTEWHRLTSKKGQANVVRKLTLGDDYNENAEIDADVSAEAANPLTSSRASLMSGLETSDQKRQLGLAVAAGGGAGAQASV